MKTLLLKLSNDFWNFILQNKRHQQLKSAKVTAGLTENEDGPDASTRCKRFNQLVCRKIMNACNEIRRQTIRAEVVWPYNEVGFFPQGPSKVGAPKAIEGPPLSWHLDLVIIPVLILRVPFIFLIYWPFLTATFLWSAFYFSHQNLGNQSTLAYEHLSELLKPGLNLKIRILNFSTIFLVFFFNTKCVFCFLIQCWS
jgi:hypothetical protein